MSFFTWFFLGLLELVIWLVSRIGILTLVVGTLIIWACLGSIGGSYWMMITP